MGGERAFRFGVVATPRAGGRAWRETVRRLAGLGYGSVLMPDGVGLPSPFPALAMAATVDEGLRVGTFVAATPLRSGPTAAWEAWSLTALTDGRFELGIGTGIPQSVGQGAALLGGDELTARQRLGRVEETLGALREREEQRSGTRTPVLIAAGGPRSRALAAREADTVTLATAPDTPASEVATLVADVRERAGARGADIEFAANTFVVGDDVPPEMARWTGVDPARLAERDALTILPGDPRRAADEIRRRRADVGISYVLVPETFAATLAPAVAELAGS
ncbi:LLM class flavin-dependent oxidoreductase [Pseudonocardia endophytica]|uniref:Alkanesulfonate monooxygenase SsuD/methylene tetrahydromethanopterin reductase-like flavin-dependent oxidoreductase (Luciferase family) n=1 Tax=Pseudonocardia endophytica TaxID=401976 RepID=A0A4R1I539_PSEEN|nr:LLM class flavin-dependent oxidoreductase [Pseudonocardia endophytica]TCK25142.1 alkanesulfonate monooxygenase SsuD/methylene tetrahydromethanopterin reductase-like flavin-dependent oxidoreductase (luciferase family) [Pseudonocardia endophytica]